jgi:subtilisin family serine protease
VARAADWARGIAASRGALAVSVDGLAAIPPALQTVTDDLAELKEVLRHFFTYGADGAYYRRWAGAGRDPGNAAHLTPEYKQNNVREVRLERDRLYLYMAVPESLLSGGGDLGQGAFREVVVRFDDTGLADRPFDMATLHTARWRRDSAPHEDFVFFYAEDGDGIPAPPDVRAKLSPQLQGLLGALQTAGDALAALLQASPLVIGAIGGAAPQILLIATVDGEPQLPAGVIADGEGSMRALLVAAQVAKVLEVAAVPQIRHLGLLPPARAANDQARAMVSFPGLQAKIPAAKQDGTGVVVGVIDTGIDGGHPAFAGRIAAYWDQATTAANVALPPGNSPAANHPGNAAYAPFAFGVELTGAATAGARDPGGHGTHVAGTAAGAEVRDGAGNVLMPAGLAPKATIVAVRAIEVGPSNFLLGIRYIFQKATELGFPCVINMSFGQHFHPHDGTDAVSRALVGVVTNAAGAYLPGRILVASAGNDRGRNYHVRRPLAPRGAKTVAEAALLLPVQLGDGLREEHVNIWVGNPNPAAAAGTVFPVAVWVFRRNASHSRNTATSVTSLVPLGQSTAGTPSGAGTFATHRVRIDLVTALADPFNGDFSIQVNFASTAPPLGMLGDQWVIAIDNGSAQPLDVHAWIATAPSSTRFIPQGMFGDDDAFLSGVPAASPATVSVASVNSRLAWNSLTLGARVMTSQSAVNELSTFSSPGPLRPPSRGLAAVYPNLHHEINAVDVAAPGCRILSALSGQLANPDPGDVVTPRAWLLQGTSMASPVVTGLVANLLGDNAALTLPLVLDRLRNASTIPAASEYQPPPPPVGTPAPAHPLSQDWGYGLVNGSLLK